MPQPLFTGNYGASLAQVNTAPIERAGAAMGQAFQSIGTSIASAMEKHEKKKKEKEQEEATRVMLAGAFENNKDVAAAMGYPEDAEGQKVFLDAAAKNPNTMPTMTAFLNARALTQRLTQEEELHPVAKRTAEAGAEVAELNLRLQQALEDGNLKLAKEIMGNKLMQAQAEKEFRELGGGSGEIQKKIEDLNLTNLEQQIAAGEGEAEQRAYDITQRPVQEAAARTAQQLKEEQVRQAKLKSDLFESTLGDQVDMAKLQTELTQVQLDSLNRKLRSEELVAGMKRNKEGMLIFPKGDYSPAERDRAIQEFEKRENADKLLELELKKGRWDVKRIKALAENGSSTGTSQMERSLKLALKTGKITPEEFVDFQVQKVKKDIGLADLTPEEQYKIAKNFKVGAGASLESYENLVRLAETGGDMEGKPVKFSKDGKHIEFYTRDKNGKRKKQTQPYSPALKEKVTMFRSIRDGVLPGASMDTTTGNDADQSDEDLDQLVTDSIFGE